MNQKELGKTGILVPEIGFGTYQYRGTVTDLRKAVSSGVTLIDTAESYGTEDVVGEAIRGARQRVFLATKVSPEHFGRRDLLTAAENSLKRLRTDYIDLYQLHRPNYVVPIAETMATVQDLVREGKVRFVGVSNFSVAELKAALAVLGGLKIVSNQVRFSLIDRSIESGLLRFCQENDISVIAYSPLGRGLDNIRRRDPGDVLARVAGMVGRTEAQVVLNWCVARPRVVAIPKATSARHVQENCGASDWRLSPDHLRLLDRIGFRRRGTVEDAIRRTARRFLQRVGYRAAFVP